MFISVLDYSTGTISILHDEVGFTKDLQNDDIEALLSALGHNPSQISFMITDDCPDLGRNSLSEILDDNYGSIEAKCLERLKSAEDE